MFKNQMTSLQAPLKVEQDRYCFTLVDGFTSVFVIFLHDMPSLNKKILWKAVFLCRQGFTITHNYGFASNEW